MKGTVIKLLSGVYTVTTSEGEYLCRAKGSFRKIGISPVPGDEVEILALPDHTGRIEEILPRKNYMIRPNVANVDYLCYVCACGKPTPFPFTIDKMLIIAQHQKITPVLIFNKTDLPDTEEVNKLVRLYTELGYTVFSVSAVNGNGIDDLRCFLDQKTVVFAGNSGVGKSSLLNALYPELELQTGEISDKLGRGRHTTRHIELYPSNGALIGDTPGFGALELEGYPLNKEDLNGYFVEFSPYLEECAFLNCAHVTENECGIKHAVQCKKIDSSRFESYLQVYNFLKEAETPWIKKAKN